MCMSNYVICTADMTFVGATTIGNLRSDLPANFAYCYDTIVAADAVARSLGLVDYMLGAPADFA